MILLDQFTRRVIGFATHQGKLTGVDICCVFNRIILKQKLPKYLSSDNDPLFTFYRWLTNLRVLNIEEIKTVPYSPMSHPFIERLIGTVRREFLNRTLFWNERDLQNKLELFQRYYNDNRCHHGIKDASPLQKSTNSATTVILLNKYRWQNQYRRLFQLPIAA